MAILMAAVAGITLHYGDYGWALFFSLLTIWYSIPEKS